MRGASLSLCVQLLNLHLTTWHALQQQLQRVHTTWKKYLTRRPSRLQRNSPQIPTTNNLKQRNSPRKIPTTNKQTNNLKPRQALLLGRLKVVTTKDRRESRRRRRKREQPQPNTSLKERTERNKRDREKRCVSERTREGAPHKWGGNLDKPQVGRKRRRCWWLGEEQINGNRSFQATRERERDIYRSRLPITRRIVRRVHSECAKLPGRAQFSVAASPTMTTSFNGWMGWLIAVFSVRRFIRRCRRRLLCGHGIQRLWMDGWMDYLCCWAAPHQAL